MVQFIGGEPTLYPELPELVCHAVVAGVQVEVFSNLVHVTRRHCGRCSSGPVCDWPRSYYSDEAAQHAAVTGRAGSHARTRANIVEALRRSIPLRIGVIDWEVDDTSRARAVQDQALPAYPAAAATDRTFVALDQADCLHQDGYPNEAARRATQTLFSLRPECAVPILLDRADELADSIGSVGRSDTEELRHVLRRTRIMSAPDER